MHPVINSTKTTFDMSSISPLHILGYAKRSIRYDLSSIGVLMYREHIRYEYISTTDAFNYMCNTRVCSGFLLDAFRVNLVT